MIDNQQINYFDDIQMVDATQIWNISGRKPEKHPTHFLHRESVQKKIHALVVSKKDLIGDLYSTKVGRNGGTRMCPDLAIAYAEWLSLGNNCQIIEDNDDNSDDVNVQGATEIGDEQQGKFDVIPTCFEKNGKILTDSLTVAAVFGKRHDNVLQSIQKLDCSKKFSVLNFQETFYDDEQGKKRPKYEIARDGFSFLVMGFRGKLAAHWKEKYIEAFNAMEKEILVSKNLENDWTPERKINLYRQGLSVLTEFGILDDQDKFVYGDAIRNEMKRVKGNSESNLSENQSVNQTKPAISQFDIFEDNTGSEKLLEISKPVGEFWSVGERIVQLGFRYDLSDAMKIGQSVAQAYRKRYKQKPKSYIKMINGQIRKVKYYGKDDLDILDNAIQEQFSSAV